jgi:hypothetical protein
VISTCFHQYHDTGGLAKHYNISAAFIVITSNSVIARRHIEWFQMATVASFRSFKKLLAGGAAAAMVDCGDIPALDKETSCPARPGYDNAKIARLHMTSNFDSAPRQHTVPHSSTTVTFCQLYL